MNALEAAATSFASCQHWWVVQPYLLGKYRNLEHEVDTVREQLEEESQSKSDSLRQLSKSVGDANMWRQKYEREGLAKAEELEAAKMKIQSRLAEAPIACKTSKQNYRNVTPEPFDILKPNSF